MKYYKVVREICGQLHSLMYYALPTMLSVRYQAGVWIHGKFGPLFIFNDLVTAERFRNNFTGGADSIELWEVEAEDVKSWYTAVAMGNLRQWATQAMLTRRLRAFFKGNFQGYDYALMDAPSGTMAANKVKLVRKVR